VVAGRITYSLTRPNEMRGSMSCAAQQSVMASSLRWTSINATLAGGRRYLASSRRLVRE
jgi:hypothetical protein